MDREGAQTGPDLTAGIPLSGIREGAMLRGHVEGEAVMIARSGSEIFAIGSTCTHYGGPLAEGLMVGDTVRCPWHHACFSLRTGEALRAPAFEPVPCWRVERKDGSVFVREKLPSKSDASPAARRRSAAAARHMLILGGGAAGFAAAEMLRREGFDGGVTILTADDAAPYDRPNLSKDYLAGAAPEAWMPLRPAEYYEENGIDLVLGVEAAEIDRTTRQVKTSDGRAYPFDKLLIATGAAPIHLRIPGAGLAHVRTLRSFADCRWLVARAVATDRAVIIGASFIGLEVAAALQQRGLEVHVVAPEMRPMEKVLGPELGEFLRSLHEQHGVVFHLGHRAKAIDATGVTLDDGARLETNLVVVGIGVRPRVTLAERAGLAVDQGILVDERLETSAPAIFAAGDAARWPDRYSGERVRIEHWVVAERQGQLAAGNMLGASDPYVAPAFFWTKHYDVVIDYVGHASGWDAIDIDGDIGARDATLRYRRGERTLAVATIFRGRESLAAEAAMERGASP
jgi:apoptosis-inducing factor 3